MIKNFFINFDPVHFSVRAATKPSSDRCINEIIFLPVLRDFTSFNIRVYFLLFVKVHCGLSVRLLAMLAVRQYPGADGELFSHEYFDFVAEEKNR